MALTAAAQRTSYPLAAYNFRVDVNGTTVGFSEVSGLKVEYETTTYRHGLSFVEGEDIVRFPTGKYTPLTLKKGIVQSVQMLCDWLDSGEIRPIDVSLCDEQGTAVVTWHIGKAIPIKLEAPAMNASGNEVAVETLELMVCRITLEHH